MKIILQVINEKEPSEFLKYLMKTCDSSSSINFRITLTPLETFVWKASYKVSDSFFKGTKRFLKEHTGVDVFSSRDAVTKLQKDVTMLENYSFTPVDITLYGKLKKSVFVNIINLESVLSARLSRLADNNQLIFNPATGKDTISVSLVGDEGGQETKLFLIIENVKQPNSTHNLLFIGFFTGDETYENINTFLGGSLQQFNSLEHVHFFVQGQLVSMPVKKKLVGDCKFLSTMFGHTGQSSAFPCHNCKIPIITHGGRKTTIGSTDFNKKWELRTLPSLLEDFKNKEFSIKKGLPLVNIDPSDCPPPPIHTLMGLFESNVKRQLIGSANKHDYYEHIGVVYEEDCAQSIGIEHMEWADQGINMNIDLDDDAMTQQKVLKEWRGEQKMLRIQFDVHDTCLKTISGACDVFDGVVNTGEVKKDHYSSCELEVCLMNYLDGDFLDTIQCTICSKVAHYPCSLIITPDSKEAIQFNYEVFQCIDCLSGTMTDRLRIAIEMKNLVNDELLEIGADCDFVSRMIKNIDDTINKGSGPMRKRLLQVFIDMDCDPRTWYPTSTGNQVRKALREENINKILEVFPTGSKKMHYMKKVMMNLSTLMTAADADVKTDEEMMAITNTVDELVNNLKESQPDAVLSVKLHLITAHLIDFIHKHHTWGLSSEQGIEAIHRLFNSLLLRYVSIKDPLLKAQLIVQDLSNYNFIGDIGSSFII